MFKKLLTLAAVAACATSINAKEVIDMTVDWTANSWNGYVMGYIPTTSAEEGLIFEWPHFNYVKVEDDGANPNEYEVVKINGEDHYIVPTEDGGPMDSWGIQAHLLTGNLETVMGCNYTVTLVAKSNKADGVNMGLPMSWNWSGGTCNGSVNILDEWAEYSVTYVDECGGTSCWLVGQMYDKEGRIAIKSVTISHEEEEGGEVIPTEWENLLVNGDAEGEYGDVPCAYGKVYAGRAADGSEIASPEPCKIETVDGSKVFVVHAKAVDPNAHPDVFIEEDGSVKGDPQWQNQFWIQSPKAWKQGDIFRVSFRYKASANVSADTQCHKETPGDYLIWHAIGSPTFTTDWQEFSKEVTVESDMDGMWSIAFNLKEYQNDVDYYFDDLKWEVMKLDEGYFIAGDFNDKNFAKAVQLLYNEDEEVYEAIVGTEDKPASEFKISTKRGDNKAFQSNCLIIKSEDLSDGDYADYLPTNGSGVKWTTFPEPGIWLVQIDEEYQQICVSKQDPTGIAGVAADNAAAVYYNLQGIRVANPTKGQVYIVKTGAKVAKQIVR